MTGADQGTGECMTGQGGQYERRRPSGRPRLYVCGVCSRCRCSAVFTVRSLSLSNRYNRHCHMHHITHCRTYHCEHDAPQTQWPLLPASNCCVCNFLLVTKKAVLSQSRSCFFRFKFADNIHYKFNSQPGFRASNIPAQKGI